MEFDCQLYLKTGTKLRKIIIDINTVNQCVSHNNNKTDFDKKYYGEGTISASLLHRL